MFVVWGLLVLPVILSLAAGIIGLVGSAKQILSGIFSLVIAGAYITLFFVIDSLAPIWNISGETSVSWGYAFFYQFVRFYSSGGSWDCEFLCAATQKETRSPPM